MNNRLFGTLIVSAWAFGAIAVWVTSLTSIDHSNDPKPTPKPAAVAQISPPRVNPAITISANAITLPSPESGNYQQLCSEQWTKRGILDVEMFNYCMGNQREGDSTLAHLANEYSGLPWMQQVIDSATEKWTKRGMRDAEMVAYEVSKQIDAYLDIKYASQQNGFQKNILEVCAAKWRSQAPDWEMTLYCYKHTTGTD
jgi:hypothetical protein